ncbi:MAG: thioredoxin family protein [Verrucomicrobiota bacterium]
MSARLQIILIAFGLFCTQSQAKWWQKKSDSTPAGKTKSAEAETTVANGMTEQDLIAVLGEPKGIISGGSKKTLMYDGVQIEILNGRVVNLPADFSTQLKEGQKEQEKKESFWARQKKKGLVLHGGDWMKPAERKRRQTSPAPAVRKPAKKINAPSRYVMRGKDNRPIDHSRYVRRGQVTVVDFYADWCGPCRALAPELDKLIKNHKGVVLQKVNIGNWGSSVAERYNVTSVPNVRIFDRNGNMVAPPTSSLRTIDANIKRAKKQ